MANNIYKKKDIKLDTFEDLNCKGVIASFSQGDRVSDKLLLRLTNDNVPLDLTDATQVRIDFRKPDGKLVFQYCIMEDKPNGLISAILTTQTLAAPGKVYAEVTVKYPEGKDVVTRQFTFHVEEAIAGDKSIESQNEWPMLERAIVAGDMLAGVDLVAIIKAGELAAGAVKRSGDTMTGNLDFDISTANKWVGWKRADGKRHYIFGGGDVIGLFSEVNSKTPWRYIPSTDTFDINAANTNVVKKAGDSMSGDLLLDYTGTGTRKISFTQGGVEQVNINRSGAGYYGMYDVAGAQSVWEYNQTSKTFNVNTTNTNLVKKTGDTITGALNFDTPFVVRGSAASWDMRPYAAGVYSKGVRHTINTANNFYAIAPTDVAGAGQWANQIALYGDTGVFDVKDLNIRGGSATNVVTKIKDGQTTLTLTSEATNVNSGYLPLAERRGNTVTIRMEITRNANSSSPLVCTLPVDLRPPITISKNCIANDGSIVGVNVIWDGKIEVYAAGKPVKIDFTYVVN